MHTLLIISRLFLPLLHLFRTLLDQNPNVSCLSVGVAAYVYDLLAPESELLVEKFHVAALARWINYERSFLRREIWCGVEDVRCVARAEGNLGRREVVEGCILDRCSNRLRRELNSSDGSEVRREYD